MDRRKFLGWVGVGYLTSTLPEITSITLSQPVQPGVDINSLPKLTQDILKEFQQFYGKPIDQDTEVGRGIYPCPTNFCVNKEEDTRSEKPAYLPFILSARRQTDALVRHGYKLLPESVRKETAFLIADRLAQYPKLYIPYIQTRKNAVIIGSFYGIENNNFSTIDDEIKVKDWRGQGHNRELKQLELAIKLVQSLGKQVIDIVYVMGDSSSTTAKDFRKHIEQKFHSILRTHNLVNLIRPLSWGADEAVWKAFARRLPPMTVKVNKNNEKARHFYDGKNTTKELVPDILSELEIVEVSDDTFDAQVFICDRYHSDKPGHYNFDYIFPADDSKQNKLDQDFKNRIKSLPENQYSKTIIIDARNPNGALNEAFLPPSDKFFAFGSWGTFANVLGQTLAIAKLLHFALKNAQSEQERQRLLLIQRQLLLEAVTHDIFVTGYGQAEYSNSAFKKWQKSKDLKGRYIDTETTIGDCEKKPNECLRYKDYKEVQEIYEQIEAFANEQMITMMNGLGNTRFKVVPQLWHMFESQVYTSDGTLSFAGVYRTNLPENRFNPLKAATNVNKFELQQLINEFS